MKPVRILLLALMATFSVTATLPLQAQSASAPAATGEQANRAVVVSFESEDQVNQFAAKGKTVVFFFASWCPNCRATATELNARWGDVDPDITLVIADYDKETALKSKYGVTYQDTFVLLDEKGGVVKLWNSGGVDGLNRNTAL